MTDDHPRCPNCNQPSAHPYDPHYLCENPNCRVRAFDPEGADLQRQ